MYEKDHPAYSVLESIGKEITEKVKPRAIVIFSAHWQGEEDVIEVNKSENADLIYDFYGFPAHYYKEKFPNKGSREVAEKVIECLTKAGIKTHATNRGLDHGVWIPFKAVFNPDIYPLRIPIVQASLYKNEDGAQHYALGRAISTLRSQNIQIIVSGMAVHNLRDLRYTFMDPTKVLPYTASFDPALKKAVEAPPEQREEKMLELLKRKDARQAHPSFEHLLPIYVGAGAAEGDKGQRIYTLCEGSLSWAMFRFGDVPVSA